MFLAPFLYLAAVSPTRQRTFRFLVGGHLAVVGMALAGLVLAGMLLAGTPKNLMVFGNTLLVAGILEGALLVGWRLTQMPKSQALEFMLVTPLRPGQVLLAEALVGLTRLAWVTLSGLPGVAFLVERGRLLLLSVIWGAVAGLGLTAWAYESEPVRRWGERVLMAGIVLYLVVGVLAG